MNIFLVISASLLWVLSLICLYGRQTIAPVLSYVALVALSFMSENGLPLLQINGTMLIGWLCMTLIVTFSSILQPEPVRRQTRGMAYIIGGALTGLAAGLLGFTFCSTPAMLNACMVLGVVAGIFLGFLLYSRTPDGSPLGVGSRRFFSYLLAKGFPAAITVMMLGVALVLVINRYNIS